MKESKLNLRGVGLLILTMLLMGFLSGCSNSSQAINSENKQLKIKISQLEKEVHNKNNKIIELQNRQINSLTINYMENTSRKRFIEKCCDLLALPTDNAMRLNSVLENTVVTVLDTANVNNITWLYISIPVYDTPANYKGWIKEADTAEYTEDKIPKVQSDIKVKQGADMYETDNFEDIKSVKPYRAESEEHGRIQKKKDGFIMIQCAGGKTIWIKEASVIYPEVDQI